MSRIYFDNAATTMMDPLILDLIASNNLNNFANPSSVHTPGKLANLVVERARQTISSSLNASPDEIYFTSGGTESNNLIIKGIALNSFKKKKKELIISGFEHASVRETALSLKTLGFDISFLPVTPEGFVQIKKLKKMISSKTLLVSIIHANNEVGTIQPIDEIGAICQENNILFHSDICQSFNKIPLDVKAIGVDFLSFSSHKIHGPKGVGGIYCRKGLELFPLLHGGHQENNLRAGTLNTPGILGFSKAVELYSSKDTSKMYSLKKLLIDNLTTAFASHIKINGDLSHSLPNILNIEIKNFKASSIVEALDKKQISVSTGSACAEGKGTPSPVLLAMGRSKKSAFSSIRISICKWTTAKEIKTFLLALEEIIKKDLP